MKKNLIVLIAIIVLGCETVVDVDVPVEAPKLTLNSLFTPDSVWTVNLTTGRYVLDDPGSPPVNDATVIVYHNNSPIDTLADDNDGTYRSTKNKKPVEGEPYQIKATAPGLEAVTSTSYIPPYGEVVNIEVKIKSGQFSYDEPNYTIKVTFNDDGETEDFYEFEVLGKFKYLPYQGQDSVERSYPIRVESNESDSEEAVIFDDRRYNGKEVTIAMGAHVYNSRDKIFLHFRKLSKELYLYRSSSLLQTQTSGDPLAQPVHVYNNISNGYGIFGGYSERVFELKK